MTSIIIPAYNEEETIGEVVRRSAPHGEVVVVDDGSEDATVEEAEKAGARVIKQRHRGKGAALRRGLKETDGDVVLIDGDLQHLPEEIPKLLKGLEKYDLVVGARSRSSGMPIHRKMTNALSTWVVGMATGLPLTDSQSGFRAIRKKAKKKLPLKSDGFDVESEMLWEAARAGLEVGEVKIETLYGGRESHFHLWHDSKAVVSFLFGLVGEKLKGRN